MPARGCMNVFRIIAIDVIEPLLRLFLFLCISVQFFINCWGVYEIWQAESWDTGCQIFSSLCNCFTRIFECIAAFLLFTISIENNRNDSNKTKKNDFGDLLIKLGFKSKLKGMAVLFLLVCNIRDQAVSEKIMKQMLHVIPELSTQKYHMYVLDATRYATFIFGFGCFVCYSLRQLVNYCQRNGVDGENLSLTQADITTSHFSQPKSASAKSKIFNVLYYAVLVLCFPLANIVAHCCLLFLDFQKYDVDIGSRNSTGYKLMNFLPSFFLSIMSIRKICSHFWKKHNDNDNDQLENIWTWLNIYLLIEINSHTNYYESYMRPLKWDVMIFCKLYSSLVCIALVVPILISAIVIFTSPGKKLTVLQNLITSKVSFKFLRQEVFSRKSLYLFIYTVAVILGLLGGVFTTMSLTYEKFYVKYESAQQLKEISAEIEKIHNQLTEVKNGFIVVAANLNPCLSLYVPRTRGNKHSKSLHDIIRDHVTKSGPDGNKALYPSENKTFIQQIYDESTNSNFKKKCFVDNGAKLSSNQNGDCKKLHLMQEFSMKRIVQKEKENSQRPPDCSTPEKCLKNSNKHIEEYSLRTNKQCEIGACALFITGIVAAFATSFIPFVGPALAKGAQLALRITKGIKSFGKVFKRVASQVKLTGKKIAVFVKILKKVVGGAILRAKNSHQFLYVLVPALLLTLVILTIVFFRRRKPRTSSSMAFLALFMSLSVVSMLITVLSFLFSDIMTEMLVVPFENIAAIEIKTAIGMGMLKWGYLMATISSVLFFLHYCARDDTEKQEKENQTKDKTAETEKQPLISANKTRKIKNYSDDKTIPTVDLCVSYKNGGLESDVFLNIKNSSSNYSSKADKCKDCTIENTQGKEIIQGANLIPKTTCQKSRSEFQTGFSIWLLLLLFTALPAACLSYISYMNSDRVLHVDIKPSPSLEQVRLSFAHTSTLERELGNIDDLNEVTNENLCDIVSEFVKKAINDLNLPIPPGITDIQQLFDLNVQIRKDVMKLIEKVNNATDLHIDGINLFNVFEFISLPLKFENWQLVFVFGLPCLVVLIIMLCTLITCIQELGFWQANETLNRRILPFLEQMIMPASFGSLFNQLAIIGMFSFIDGFETPMFVISIKVGRMVIYGIYCSVLCVVAAIIRMISYYTLPMDE